MQRSTAQKKKHEHLDVTQLNWDKCLNKVYELILLHLLTNINVCYVVGKRTDLERARRAIVMEKQQHGFVNFMRLCEKDNSLTAAIVPHISNFKKLLISNVNPRDPNEQPVVRLYLGASGGGKSFDCKKWLLECVKGMLFGLHINTTHHPMSSTHI